MENNECCPKLYPTKWENQILEWKDKLFVKGKVFTFFFMPLNYGSVMTKLTKKIDEAGAKMIDNLCLSDHSSKWNMDLYLAVDKEIEGLENIKLSGKFLSKVYDGEYQNTGTWTKDFEDYALKNNYKVKKQYMWYTTCPKCAKKYGKNYTVILGELD